MVRSLEIRNYRNLRHLTIEKLGRVNLLVGKNNTGKTSVLEAVYLWANYGRFETVYEIIEARDGLFESISEDRFVRSQAVLASLYTDRLSYNSSEKISITFQKESKLSTLTLNLSPNKVKIEGSVNDSFWLDFVAEHSDYPAANHIRADQFLRLKEPDFPSYNFPNDIKNQFIRSNEVSNVSIGFLARWDSLTGILEKENYTVSASPDVNGNCHCRHLSRPQRRPVPPLRKLA